MKTICWVVVVMAIPLFGAPPQISDAEQAACEMAAVYLATGAGAVVDKLSADSPFSQLPREQAVAELNARFGPAEGARWELRTSDTSFSKAGGVFHIVFPSGAEDVVFMEMSRAGGEWTVKNVRTLAEVENVVALRTRAASIATNRKAPVPRANSAEGAGSPDLFWMIAAVIAGAGASVRRRYPRSSSAVLIVALLFFVFPVARSINPDWRSLLSSSPAVNPDHRPFVSLATSVSARERLARGETLDAPATGPEAAEVVSLWNASLARPEQVEKTLARIELLSVSPFYHLLRGRQARWAGRPADAAEAYNAYAAVAPRHDTYWLEEVLARQEAKVERANSSSSSRQTPSIDSIPSRDAGLYYTVSLGYIALGDHRGAILAFQEGWRLLPLPRADLVAMGVYAPILADPAISTLINLRQPDDDATADASLSTRPMRVPTDGKATAVGKNLTLLIRSAVLSLPGAALIAPKGTTATSAAAFKRAERERALRAVEAIPTPRLESSSMQRRIKAAIEALAERNQWRRILELTNSITPQSIGIDPALVTWRLRALVRLQEYEKAKSLSRSPALRSESSAGADVGTFLEVSELMAEAKAWDEAITMVKIAGTVHDAPDVTPYLRSLDMRRGLAASVPAATTANFDMHTSSSVAASVASRIGDLLESELARIRPRFGLDGFRRTRVNVVGWQEFQQSLTGSDHIVGFYDGDITVPFGQVSDFRESVVSILTHELTHAVVAQASNDTVPRWLQEGLATRTELVERQANIFQTRRPHELFALELIDATMRGSLDPEAVEEAYVVAHTFVRFMESRYGETSITSLINAYRSEKDDEAALREVTGKSIPELDKEFRAWGLTNAGPFVDRTPWPYGGFVTTGATRPILDGIRWSKPDERRNNR